jgi:predicted alpha/beta superfamily hydrolase
MHNNTFKIWNSEMNSIIKAPSIEGEYNYSIIWMKDMKAVFKIIVKK